jgi:hypothetical protein
MVSQWAVKGVKKSGSPTFVSSNTATAFGLQDAVGSGFG